MLPQSLGHSAGIVPEFLDPLGFRLNDVKRRHTAATLAGAGLALKISAAELCLR